MYNEYEIAFMDRFAEERTDTYADGDLTFERMQELANIIFDGLVKAARQDVERKSSALRRTWLLTRRATDREHVPRAKERQRRSG